jgi:hypothetical protein
LTSLTVVNFSHPLTPDQLDRIGLLLDLPEGSIEVVTVPVHFDNDGAFGPQAEAAVDAAGITWEGAPVVVVLPALSTIAASVLAAIDGRSGSLPAVVRLAPGRLPGTWDVAEILDLRAARLASRARRRHLSGSDSPG